MTRLATAGTSSCATIALQGFKETDYQMNESFLKGDDVNYPVMNKKEANWGNDESVHGFDRAVLSVGQLYSQYIYPTRQQLARTGDYPLDLLMKEVDGGSFKTKYTTAILNSQQMQYQNGYWPKRLHEWGFRLVDVTINSIGNSSCYCFVRNLNRPDNIDAHMKKYEEYK